MPPVYDNRKYMVVYNLDCVEVMLIKTDLSHEEVVKKAIDFRNNGGRYESDFIALLCESGCAEQIPIKSVDWNYLDEYMKDYKEE